ncbi:hypothetical protein Gorai_009269, partial [Gossypium raimondii]|nr:hypothetical protein [Gossypium raimondii]
MLSYLARWSGVAKFRDPISRVSKANEAAHMLAAKGRRYNTLMYLIEKVPKEMEGVVNKDGRMLKKGC